MRQLKEIAFGEMGMLDRDFRKSNPEYFMIRLAGMRNAQHEQLKQMWEMARYQAMRANTGFMDARRLPRTWWELPWDENKKSDFNWDEFNRMMDEKYPVILGEA